MTGRGHRQARPRPPAPEPPSVPVALNQDLPGRHYTSRKKHACPGWGESRSTRPTSSHREPDSHYGEPVDDVLSGVDHLVEEGIADDDRVGIMGHSHGAGLGPLVVAERPEQFVAAAFAEGAVDKFSLYGQMPGYLNVNVHEDVMWGSSPYRNPERYLELSPIFDEGVRSTPTLLEFGQESLAVQGLEYGSALWREGTAHELVVYPDAGHNLRKPALQRDAMRRNLEWWARWIDPGPSGNR